MEPSKELQQLVFSAQAGERESFRVLYGMLSPRVFRFIRPRARNRDDALDVLQETFIDFWKGLPTFSYEGDTALDAFLYRIASRKLNRITRRLRGDISLESFRDLVVEQQTANDIQQNAIDIAIAMRRMSSLDREILILRHMEGRSFSDISQLLGHSENTLKVRHHRAINRLRNIVQYDQ